MVGESGTSRNGSTHRYYKCINAKRCKGCHKKAVHKKWIEDIVVKQLVQTVWNNDLIDDLIEKVFEYQSRESTIIPMLTKELAEVVRGINNVVDAIQKGIITESTKERLEGLEKNKHEIESLIAKKKSPTPS